MMAACIAQTMNYAVSLLAKDITSRVKLISTNEITFFMICGSQVNYHAQVY